MQIQWEKTRFEPKKNVGKTGIMRFSKTRRKLAVVLRLSSNFQGSQPFDCKRCAKNKIGLFTGKKITFWSKILRKNGFFNVLRQGSRKTLRKFAVKLQLSSNSQGSRPCGREKR